MSRRNKANKPNKQICIYLPNVPKDSSFEYESVTGYIPIHAFDKKNFIYVSNFTQHQDNLNTGRRRRSSSRSRSSRSSSRSSKSSRSSRSSRGSRRTN